MRFAGDFKHSGSSVSPVHGGRRLRDFEHSVWVRLPRPVKRRAERILSQRKSSCYVTALAVRATLNQATRLEFAGLSS